MIDKEISPERKIRNEARALTKRVHPDSLTRLSETVAGLREQGEALIPLLAKITHNPYDMNNWGDEINSTYQGKGSPIVFVGLSKDGSLREPRTEALRKPDVFLQMLREYLDTGDISQELLDTPHYDPGFSFEDNDDESWGQQDPEGLARESARLLKEGIAGATDFDHFMGLRLATKMSAQHNMRMYGVLKALDEKVAGFLTREIKGSYLNEELERAEEHIRSFDFDDKTITPQLEELLNEQRTRVAAGEQAPIKPAHPAELLAGKARSIEELLQVVVEDVETGTFETEQDRVNTLKSINSMAKKLLIDECKKNTSLEKFSATRTKAQKFPFTDDAYGMNVVDIIDMGAKYFALNTIFHGRSNEELDTVASEIDHYIFRQKENTEYLQREIEKRRAKLSARRRAQ